MDMSRSPPAFRAVTVPPSPGLAAIATPTGMSDGPAPVTGTVATGRAGRDRGAGLGFDGGSEAGGAGAFAAAGLEGESGTGRLPWLGHGEVLGPS